MKNKASIVIPVFNEAGNIIKIYEEIKLANIEERIDQVLFVNDCSNDKTGEILNKLSEKYKIINVISNETNKGQSYSLYKGIKNVKNNIVVTLDGDCQNDPKDILKLLDLYLTNEDIQLISGIRKNRKDKLSKIISSKIANFIRNIFLQDGCLDTGCSLKVFNKEIFLKFPFFDGIHRFIPALFVNFGYLAKYVEVSHRERYKGKTKYGNFKRAISGILGIYTVLKIIKNKR